MSKPPATQGLTPFSLHIFWDGREGRSPQSLYTKYIKAIYEFFNRAESDPLDIYLGIPVYLHPEPMADVEKVIGQSSAQSCSLVFIDAHTAADQSWLNCLEKITNLNQSAPSHLFLPLRLTKKRVSFLSSIQSLNLKGAAWRIEEFLIRIAHTVYRHLAENEPGHTASTPAFSPKDPMQIFISHAKADGKDFAKGLKDRIDDIPELRSYYDAKDIPLGFGFAREIEAGIARSVLLVLHTDQFSSREWCRQEVVYAKKHNRPVLVVNRFKQGENRSFPYLGNVPHLRFSAEPDTAEEEQEMYDLILLSIIAEGLRLRISDLSIKMLTRHLGVTAHKVFKYSPELLTVSGIDTQESAIIIYPDPPLGQSEQGILEDFNPQLTFITPTLLPLLSADGKTYDDLKGLRVSLSLSEIRGHTYEWVDNNIIQDVAAAITRYLLVGGGVIQYGGSLHYDRDQENPNNFVQLLKMLVQTYRNDYEQAAEKVIKPIDNYIFFPISTVITAQEKENMADVVNFHEVPLNERFRFSAAQAAEVMDLANDTPHIDKLEKRTIWSICLMEMRQKMVEEEEARVVLGGKWIGFLGRMPGILEEVIMSLQHEKPLYILGGFGGVSAGVAACLQGKTARELNIDYYRENDLSYFNFLEKFNDLPLTKNLRSECNYQDIAGFIKNRGESSSNFGLNNGLNRTENIRLFESKSTLEIVCLILKGLRTLKSKN